MTPVEFIEDSLSPMIEVWREVGDVISQAKTMEMEYRGYSREDVINIFKKSRETGLTVEYLLTVLDNDKNNIKNK